ncbi:hypothetical protein OIDMADRAFT_45853 [Oidiodendron maius Zn]|uniref:Aflatoxin biosynthesis ketoreductase nor-1 n=1 Tax=Oidiodendron maius (strain Zn) TaxID=913774 RepID=A0A0C3GUH5_OIDMZ|nr:hypothetical protein OIDMADRAFT_45853 [Oidiodendron maius Zn]
MATQTTYLITGVTSGIGYGLLQAYLAQPNLIVIAGVRDPSVSSEALKRLPAASGTKLIVVKIDSASDTDAKSAVGTLAAEYGIKKLDVVLANAGLGHSWEKVLSTPAETVRKYTEVNTIGPLLLFQAVYPLLAAALRPKFFVMATAVSSFGLMENFPLPSAGYGASKAGLNYIARKIHFEHESMISVCLYPGWVKTELGNTVAKSIGMQEASISIDKSVEGILAQIDAATREGTSGKFIDYEGNSLPW